MSAARTRGNTGKGSRKMKDKEVEETVRRQREARAFYEQQRRRQAGLPEGIPSGRAIGEHILGKCNDEELQAQERYLRLAHKIDDPGNCTAKDTNLSCPKNYKDAKKKIKISSPR